MDDLRAELVTRMPRVDRILSTRHILYGDVLAAVPSLFKQWQVAGAWLVGDENTYPLLGAALQQCGADIVGYTMLPNGVHPTETVINQVVSQAGAQQARFLIAVGSGTINDIVKYASFLMGVPYIVFPTAPSMNGYISANASIIKEGFRTSVAAHLPMAVLCDVDIVAQAPVRLIRSGIGDSLCRSTVQVDWYLSHIFRGTEYDEAPFQLLAPYEERLLMFDGIDAARADVRSIIMALLAGGVGMVLSGGSYPASQGEHMWAHTMDMMGEGKGSYHGEEIAVTSWYMVQLQRVLVGQVEKPMVVFDSDDEVRAKLRGVLSEEVIESCLVAYRLKTTLVNNSDWGACRTYLESKLPSQKRLSECYRCLDLPRSPEAIGWSRSQCERAFRVARLTRDRFTALDFFSAQEFLLDESEVHH